jgi:hypothetical protein
VTGKQKLPPSFLANIKKAKAKGAAKKAAGKKPSPPPFKKK